MIEHLPPELISSLQNITGFHEERFKEVHRSDELVTSIRINPKKISGEQFDAYAAIPWNPYGYYLPQRPVFTLDPLLHAGAYYVQEAASQFLWEVLRQNYQRSAPVTALDLCAAPGGKSTLLSTYFTNGLVVANEVIKSRAAVLEENITKWGNMNVVVTNNDPQQFQRLEGFFDVMVVDAPCSGSGLFRKDNEALEEWSIANVELCRKRQQRILQDAYTCLKKEGMLIYSTCSYSPAENEEMVDYILQHFNVQPVRIAVDKDWNITETISEAKQGYGYRFFPYAVRSEGFFVAAFLKNDGTVFTDSIKGNVAAGTTKETAEINKWISYARPVCFFKIKDTILAMDAAQMQALSAIRSNLYVKKAGIEIGEIKNKGLVPAHALAVSEILNHELPSVEVSKEVALDFLSRQEIRLENINPGWTVIQYNSLPLGWIKVLPARVNNYYPVEWRILMKTK